MTTEQVKTRPLLCGKRGVLGAYVGKEQKLDKTIILYRPSGGGKNRRSGFVVSIFERLFGKLNIVKYEEIDDRMLRFFSNRDSNADGAFDEYAFIDWGKEGNTFLNELGIEMKQSLTRALKSERDAKLIAEFSESEVIKKRRGIDEQKEELQKEIQRLKQGDYYGGR